jgi:hypothetical protein
MPLRNEELLMRTFAILIAIVLQAGAALADSRLGWSDLIDPSAQKFEDPYRDLSYDHLEAVATVARLRARLASGEVAAEAQARIETRLDETEAAVAAAGIDADWLIAQRWVVAERRERAASAGNPGVDGAEVMLAGYAIPAPAAGDETPMAYLVPERGMCAHVPPPPPNQMIRLRLSPDWTPRMMHEPVQITGRLHIAPSERKVMVVDGLVAMRATFAMDVREVETLGRVRADTRSTAVATTELAARISEGRRATNSTGVGAMQTTGDQPEQKTRQLTSWARSAGGRPVDQRSSVPTSTGAR